MGHKFKTTKKRNTHGTPNGCGNNSVDNNTTEMQQKPQSQQQSPHLKQEQQQTQPQQNQQQQHQPLLQEVDVSGKQEIPKVIPMPWRSPVIQPEMQHLQLQSSPLAPTPPPSAPRKLEKTPVTPNEKSSYYVYKASVGASTFNWDTYLKLVPATPAPKEAFKQADLDALPANKFQVSMMLEAKDPRNSTNWCLATVICVEGLHLRLRFSGADKMNDLYELIDSENIRAVGASPSDILLAPTGFTGNIANYPKFVDKALKDATIAPPEIFPPTPPKPSKNLFQRGMKIEAVDVKNRDFIYPATVGAVEGDRILVVFDGWKGSFDYRCEYWSRDIFPINWCERTGRAIQSPNGWTAMLEGKKPAYSPSDFRYERPSSTVNDFNKRDNEKLILAQTLAKKGRGRPKKSPTKEQQTKISKDKLKPYRPMSSTPKSRPVIAENSKIESAPTSPAQEYEELMNTDSPIEDVSDMNRFQCQRTVPYDEWQKKKLDEEQMPQQVCSQNGDTSVNLSDTTSMASTLSTSHRRDSTDMSEQECNIKRPKMDNADSCVSDELQKLLDTKPTKLSQWSVDDVLDVLKTESSLVKYAETFEENEIDGKAFALFDEKRRDLLLSMGLKLGPVLKVLNLRELVGFHVDMSDMSIR